MASGAGPRVFAWALRRARLAFNAFASRACFSSDLGFSPAMTSFSVQIAAPSSDGVALALRLWHVSARFKRCAAVAQW